MFFNKCCKRDVKGQGVLGMIKQNCQTGNKEEENLYSPIIQSEPSEQVCQAGIKTPK